MVGFLSIQHLIALGNERYGERGSRVTPSADEECAGRRDTCEPGVPRISWTRPLTPLRSGLKLFRTDAPEMSVTTCRIIKRLNVVGNVSRCQISVLVDLFLDAFLLQAAEERFGNGVVPTVASSTHARFEPVGTAEATPIITTVLTPWSE